MLTSFSGKAIMTKAKAMYGKHLTADQYRELMYKKSIPEIASYLKENTAYRDILEGVVPSTVYRGQLESLLRKHRFIQYGNLLRYDASREGSYYSYLMVQVEIDQILQMLRYLNSDSPEEYLFQYPAFLSKRACFSFLKLAHVKTFDELTAFLSGTPYSHLLLECRPSEGEKIDYTRCEKILLTYYYGFIHKVIEKDFRGSTKKQLQEIFKTQVELQNITMIYRMKKYFPEMDSEAIKSLLIPWERIPQRELDRFLSAPDAESFLSRLSNSAYRNYLDGDDFVFIEYQTGRIRYHLNKRHLRFSTNAPTAFTAYMVLSEIELGNLTTIIEGVRYSVPPDEIEAMLIL